MSHVNATLTPRTRLRLARLIVEQGWTYAAAAKMFMVASKTAKKWADRYRAEGVCGMADRSSRPHTSPTRTSDVVVRRIVRLRWRRRIGPVQIAGLIGMPSSTVHAVLTRCRINRLSRIDRVTGEPLRRYEHDVTIERVLSDNGSCYRSHTWRDVCTELDIKHKRTRPYRPQTNGKIERFHRTLSDGWAYARFHNSETERRTALPHWIHFYNHHRAHSAIGGNPPITRLTKVPRHHT